MSSNNTGETIRKRDSDITRKVFPFEVIHTTGPANNMRYFHWHDYMEISRVDAGSGVYHIEGKRFSVTAGDIVVINNIERHRVTYEDTDPLFETVLHFSPTFIWSKENSYFDYNYLKLFLYEGARFNNRPLLEPDVSREMGRIIGEIKSEYLQKPPHYELMVKSKLLTIITHLLRHTDMRTEDRGDYLIRKKNIERIENILKYINENFKEDLSLAAIADQFAMNPAYFSDFFRKNVGVTFLHYLTRTRINEAIHLLNENRLNSTEVAYAAGFSSTGSFYKAFRRVTGGNPGEYKHSVLK
ncbi:MAG: AraC family transcriptional regulator [Spirochaetales bacterium]|nr:MAG: AraC family transcriptional regulator [Spirochaetales bacterium]